MIADAQFFSIAAGGKGVNPDAGSRCFANTTAVSNSTGSATGWGNDRLQAAA